MAFALRFALFALFAVAVPVYSNDVNIAISSTLGDNTSESDSSEEKLSVLGLNINNKLSSSGKSEKLELGLPGGLQAKVILPLIAKNISSNVEKTLEGAEKKLLEFLKNPIKSGSFIKYILPNITLDLPGISNFSALVKNTGGLLNDLVKNGLINEKKMIDIGGSVFKSALNNSESAIAKLADTLELAVNKSLLSRDECLQILKLAVDNGLHNIAGSAKDNMENFLKSHNVTKKLGSDLVCKLTDLGDSLSDSFKNGISCSKSSSSDESDSSSSNDDDDEDNNEYASYINITFTTPFGNNTLKIKSGIKDLSFLGGPIEIKSNCSRNSQKLQLGLPGGFQAKLITPLISKWDDFVGELNKTAKTISCKVEKVIKEVQKKIQEILKNPIKLVNHDLISILNKVINANSSLGSNIKNILPSTGSADNIVEGILKSPNVLQKIGSKTVSEMLDSVLQLVDSTEGATKNITDSVSELADSISKSVTKGITNTIINLNSTATYDSGSSSSDDDDN